MKTVVLQLIASFFGALGFSLIFNVEKKNLLPCALGGVAVWAAYLFSANVLLWGDLLSAAVSAAVCQLVAEALARILKAPTTTFCIPSLVPLIPGGSLYRTMDAIILRDWEQFRLSGSATLQIAFGIAIGLSFVSGFLFILRRKKRA